ncbi:universal stress protein [Flagellimonas sediminis]|uniref:Universal stress protein n=1 Tax=Flagellimonas sediminis TaxID=2696468 RepID=A0A6I5KWN1_9FLAO|nr:universal stress protein [Allomuricauda sediminis]NDV44993.1 universal stress protein [Allomuricauda sediminis]|tara:strand:+ start:5102 stop:5944 length:843 start_codon:yes stop_codon:yes gene_type:complete
MKQILIPTDFSDNAWNAIKYGLEMFKKTRCTFYLMHVNTIPHYSGAGMAVGAAGENINTIILKDSKEKLRRLLDRIKKEIPLNTGHTFVPLALFDIFVDAIKRQSENKRIDLIIMGTKGATGLKKATIGSNTGDVITRVKCPLLVIPEDAEYAALKEIAFPTDYQIGYDMNVLDTLIEMLTMNKTKLSILHISKNVKELSEEQHNNKNFLHDYLVDVDHSFHSVTGQSLETAIQHFVESRDIDMIAMVAKNLNFFQRILFRPEVEKISYHTEVPFLVLHE